MKNFVIKIKGQKKKKKKMKEGGGNTFYNIILHWNFKKKTFYNIIY